MTYRLTPGRTALAAGVLLVAVAGTVLLWSNRPEGEVLGDPPLRETSRLSVALAGDILSIRPLHTRGGEAGLREIVDLIRHATLGLANLEQNLLEEPATSASAAGVSGWPSGTARTAQDLAQFGFTVLSCANNHAMDYGLPGMRQTMSVLSANGMRAVGCGDDLDAARAPVFVGERPHRVAVLAVATSVDAAARAQPLRGPIKGRAGVSALRYVPDITVDAGTFAALAGSLAAIGDDPTPSDDAVSLAGTPIKKGEETTVRLVADERDVEDVLARVTSAREQADAVIVSIHAHEPSNVNEAPAEFVQDFARRAIRAGADLVVGHGPHRLRGIEVFEGGAILYSLGNFVFDLHEVPEGSADVYERGVDLYGLALGDPAAGAVPVTPDDPSYWESVLALAVFDADGLDAIEFHPIDLGVGQSAGQQGTPRRVRGDRAAEILNRLASLSEPFRTALDIGDDKAVVRLGHTRGHVPAPSATTEAPR